MITDLYLLTEVDVYVLFVSDGFVFDDPPSINTFVKRWAKDEWTLEKYEEGFNPAYAKTPGEYIY